MVHASGRLTRSFPAPFVDTSMSEDLHFVERALHSCHRMLPVSGVNLAYTRHDSAANNTWRPPFLAGRMVAGAIVPPPPYVDDELSSSYMAAERDAAARAGSCRAIARHAPPDIGYPLLYPYMPRRCCAGRSLPRPCKHAHSDCGDYFCGPTKGLCTASCTCEGEAAHGQPGRAACGTVCCHYWHAFWREHPENCTTSRGVRPLKRHYCSGAGKHRRSHDH